ncbi:MAG: universal stress protein [Caldilineaceae bacterium]|nr:universal stress protein [Caldilineaceae bacterium]MCB9151587.1 universal stress protein [Caldilineaceae bacterium]
MSKRKVLITLDGSNLSQQIIPAVEKLFSAPETDLLLFSVVTVPLTTELPGHHSIPSAGDTLSTVMLHSEHDYQHDIEVQAEKYYEIEQALAAQRTRDLQEVGRALEHAGYSVIIDSRAGAVAEAITKYAQSKKVDVIAMATHGRSGLTRLLMGSVAEEVVRTSAIPVLLLRPDEA